MIASNKQKSLSQLIKEADLIFAEYIKLRDTNNGVINCFVCGKPVKRNESEAMHFIPRQHMNTRYNPHNVFAGDVDCNKFDPDHNERFHDKIVSTFGRDFVMGLTVLGVSLMKPTRSDIQEIIDTYKEKVKELKKSKHL